jgi:hypothetical protein
MNSHSIRSDTLHRLGRESGTPCDPYANGTVSVTAIGTDSEGGTTYVEVETAIHSFFVTDQVHSSSLARPQTVEVIPVTGESTVWNLPLFSEVVPQKRSSKTRPDGA